MSKFGLKVSKKGSKVQTDNLDELSLDPNHPALKVYKSGQGTVVAIDGDGSGIPYTGATVYHGLGYVPIFLVYIEDQPGNDTRWLIHSITPVLTGPAWFAQVDENELKIIRSGTYGGDGYYDYYYYIFYDQA